MRFSPRQYTDDELKEPEKELKVNSGTSDDKPAENGGKSANGEETKKLILKATTALLQVQEHLGIQKQGEKKVLGEYPKRLINIAKEKDDKWCKMLCEHSLYAQNRVNMAIKEATA